jgi:hypothetical protein
VIRRRFIEEGIHFRFGRREGIFLLARVEVWGVSLELGASLSLLLRVGHWGRVLHLPKAWLPCWGVIIGSDPAGHHSWAACFWLAVFPFPVAVYPFCAAWRKRGTAAGRPPLDWLYLALQRRLSPSWGCLITHSMAEQQNMA